MGPDLLADLREILPVPRDVLVVLHDPVANGLVHVGGHRVGTRSATSMSTWKRSSRLRTAVSNGGRCRAFLDEPTYIVVLVVGPAVAVHTRCSTRGIVVYACAP